MPMMFEKAIRGGISQVGEMEYFNADNKHAITHLDANNLYGYAIGQKLPHGGIKCLSEKKIKNDRTNIKKWK